ncbi:MAG: reverse transcriptase family protein, partial [Planctomycetota bacterium]|nr:reverse transcriptase family protein [Planctomycetota bacterium]
LFSWLWGLITGKSGGSGSRDGSGQTAAQSGRSRVRLRRRRPTPRLTPRNSTAAGPYRLPQATAVSIRPYRFARRTPDLRNWFDFSGDVNPQRLGRFQLPPLATSDDVARWLGITTGELAWLSGRFWEPYAPATIQQAHYHFVWINKRRGGRRLIEIPKARLRAVQDRILRQILDHIPAHSAAHGFVTGRSNRSNAEPHVEQNVLLKLDLRNFYPSVSFSRVVAIFRSLGFSREAAGWFGRLTTTATPKSALTSGNEAEHRNFLRRHLPQGASTSPALANLSAFVLDLRLSGLARSFHANYTRYADDITFSGDERFRRSIAVFLPLVRQIISQERFQIHPGKLRVERRSQRQSVTGVVVNAKTNIRRDTYDRLKAILTNCVRFGPSSQNRDGLPEFASHLRGRIAHVQSLNAARGEKLLEIYTRIDWSR